MPIALEPGSRRQVVKTGKRVFVGIFRVDGFPSGEIERPAGYAHRLVNQTFKVHLDPPEVAVVADQVSKPLQYKIAAQFPVDACKKVQGTAGDLEASSLRTHEPWRDTSGMRIPNPE